MKRRTYFFSRENEGKKGFDDESIKNSVNELIKNKKGALNKLISDYANNIKYYRQWKGSKIQISYENLILCPEKELKRISDFFGYPNSKVDELMKDIDFHKNNCLSHKTKEKDPFNVNTKGQSLHKFRDFLTRENKKYLENKISEILYNLA